MARKKWTREEAQAWYAKQPWMVGCNFYPSTSINSLETWQAETFDPESIDRELGWAEDIGFNVMRVYLHDLLWKQDAEGLLQRMRQYLDIAEKHNIRTTFVLFDDCWYDDPQPGKQPEPKTGLHNSGSFKAPGTKVVKNPREWGRLEDYVKGVVRAFGRDERVVFWDVYNEPSNKFLVSLSNPVVVRMATLLWQLLTYYLVQSPTAKLLPEVFKWAREADPMQPLTSGLFYMKPKMGSRLNAMALELSDIVSFHTYFPLEDTKIIVENLKIEGRPMVCTEYLARGSGNTFETHIPYFKAEKIGAINWGLVSGKTQTMYSWEDYYPNGEEPPLWYHDILRKDGSFYKEDEGQFLKHALRE